MASATVATNSTDTEWSLSVKAIGSALNNNSNNNNTAETSNDGGNSSPSSSAEKNFTVTVSPDDALTALYDQIEGVTGLKASQQRLIYRGRLIENLEAHRGKPKDESSNNNNDGDEEQESRLKIKDIVGLDDGHTIHLIKRPESSSSIAEADGSNNNNNSTSSAAAGTATSATEEESSNSTASLLAALIGLGGLDDGDSNDSAATATRQRVRSSRLGRSRRPHYRLTADDLQVSDPGTLEPVRQNLMTIHTMLPHAQVTPTENGELPSPLDSSRRWYVGQWIDVRDTVNQWLEATIVEIMTPDEILPPREDEAHVEHKGDPQQQQQQQILEPVVDPAVSAGDLEGRRKLLLEPCDVGDEGDLGGELSGFRPRRTNAGVQMLLIHYNGWPHRWDEWIRSDSERIRPFRTRTRHPSMASYSSPTTQSTFNESPPTHIVDQDNAAERPAILPELSRAVTAVNELLSVVAEEEAAQLTSEQQENLPWVVRASSAASRNRSATEEELDDLPPLDSSDYPQEEPIPVEALSSHNSNVVPRIRRRQLQMLAPLLDRLGRTLIDAAPHVASMAGNYPINDAEESVNENEAVSASDTTEESPSTLGGLLSLLSRDRRRQNSTNNSNSNENGGESSQQDHSWPVDPDYVDFATGVVNTTRGEVRSGPRSRSSNDDVAGLLGAYLAAASLGLGSGSDSNDNDDTSSNTLSLGRLLRDRGNNGGGNGAGIDIHIHAVVTAPGMPPTAIGGTGGGAGGLGIATLGATPVGGAASPRNPLTPTRESRGTSNSLMRLRTPTVREEEDDSLFSDLYSESPDPVDPNGSPEPGARTNAREERSPVSTGDNEFLGRLSSPSRRSRTTEQHSMRLEPVTTTPRRLNRSNSDASSRRSSNGASPRRRSMFGRLFGRSSRRSPNNN